GADGGCEVDPDAAHVVLPAVVLLLLPGLPVGPALPSERMYDPEVAQRWQSHLCPPRWGHARLGKVR
ncbi:hypothetical protein A2U01_0108618, partial [Trifolium medium]|nr:hypothetical protein [Trifolium medium]